MAAQHLGPVSLRVPPAGVDADTVIRELLDRAHRPAELIVVTSDKALYSYAKTAGASVLRAHEWNLLERKPGWGRDRGEPSEKPDREEAREIISVRQLLDEQIHQWRGGFADGEARVPSALDEDDSQPDPLRDQAKQ